jgi:cell division protein FtsB
VVWTRNFIVYAIKNKKYQIIDSKNKSLEDKIKTLSDEEYLEFIKEN